MSTSKKPGIENATEVIERFGGIRPMAKKMDVAVTTVQGWKKRDVIPDARRDQVLEAAQAHDIDLSGVLEGLFIANENVDALVNPAPAPPLGEPEASKEKAFGPKKTESVSIHKVISEPESEPIEKKLVAAEKRAIARSTWINLILLVVGLGAVAALLWPKAQEDNMSDERISALEEKVESVEAQQSFFGTLIPEDLSTQLDTLQQQAGEAKEQIGQALEKAQEISNDVLAEDAGNLEQRIAKLEGHVSEISGSPVLANWMDKLKVMSGSVEGQGQLDQVMGELAALMTAMGAQAQMDGASETQEVPVDQESLLNSSLNAAREQSAAMGETFENVPTTDLKAAVMLLGMNQFRSSLNRDNEAFAQDLEVLKGLIGEDNAELQTAIEKLAPHAESGVLTPSGLSGEFKTLAGDAVIESLKGENVTFQERASARFNELFQVEKDGELLTGTETQATLIKTESLLNEGDLASAIVEVESLEGNAATIMAPWISKAKVTLLAQQVKDMMGSAINTKAYGAAGGITAGGITVPGGSLPGGDRLIQDEEAGINFYKPAGKMNMPKGFGSANPYGQ